MHPCLRNVTGLYSSMKVTQVAVRPSEASERCGRPALTPELLAASGARYSRNNEGLDAILSKIDPQDLNKSVDAIFRMIDYGHQSVADMVPVAMFIDGISIWLAHFIWFLCPTAGGQESSTRYIKLSIDGLIAPEELGIPKDRIPDWRELMGRCFDAYLASLRIWESLSAEDPSILGLPSSLLEDQSELALKKVARMKRNYAFDRARYFLPVASATNVMLVMSARAWANLCQHLLSSPLPEPQGLGYLMRKELEIAAPRMLKYARAISSTKSGMGREFDRLVVTAKNGLPSALEDRSINYEAPATPFLAVMPPEGMHDADANDALADHDNRYAWTGFALQRTAVRFGWSAVGFAEIRDLNRHRTGTKFSPQIPQGFYFAADQIPPMKNRDGEIAKKLWRLAKVGAGVSATAHRILQSGDPSYVYWPVLGTQFPFEHLTTADKFIYEAELRTGTGAHFRYARHLRDALRLWYERFPSTKGLILEGSGEPE